MSRFFDQNLNHLTTYVPGEQPQNISSYIKLNTNESPFPPSKRAIKRAKAELKKLNLYPDPDAKELIGEIALFYGLSNEQVAVFNGSDELLSFCFQIFTEKGACFADITYGFYPVYAKVFGVDAKIIPLREDFSICVDDYEKEKGTVFIANPNATTGLYLPLESIEKLLCQNKDRLVVVDEAYVDFGAKSAVDLIKKYDNLIVVQTMSKSRSFAGARLGIALSNKDIISDIHRIRNCFNPYNVN
ncbi:MAG: aminotransferase class I/II-fold pyridoxal phosphate-dependent enzyme, partial [Clostridia bacterium]|nr:aminotransferase class I/II-fold pyridoxal phosphate-dependent enzyme [Clostridia bacterium]